MTKWITERICLKKNLLFILNFPCVPKKFQIIKTKETKLQFGFEKRMHCVLDNSLYNIKNKINYKTHHFWMLIILLAALKYLTKKSKVEMKSQSERRVLPSLINCTMAFTVAIADYRRNSCLHDNHFCSWFSKVAAFKDVSFTNAKLRYVINLSGTTYWYRYQYFLVKSRVYFRLQCILVK